MAGDRRKQRGTRAAPTAPVVPAFLGPENAIAVAGYSWRECLAIAQAAKVPIVEIGERKMISTRALVDALERSTAGDVASEPVDDRDREARVFARLGRGGAR